MTFYTFITIKIKKKKQALTKMEIKEGCFSIRISGITMIKCIAFRVQTTNAKLTGLKYIVTSIRIAESTDIRSMQAPMNCHHNLNIHDLNTYVYLEISLTDIKLKY